MNYRHAYHAGNHADVLKHAVLTRAIEYLKRKDKPFRIVDAHAGAGIYALDGAEAQKTREWEGGIGRLSEPFADDIEALLAPYRAAVAALNPPGNLIRYPGSPWIAAHLMRAGDRLTANELHPEERRHLAELFRLDGRVAVTGVDAATCVKAALPPPERRGLVLIDPPYERPDEAERALRLLDQGLKRFATGCFLLWYPLKADGTAARVCEGVAALAVPGTLRAELRVREAFREGGLAGSGVIVVNPPWMLEGELALLLPALGERLGLGQWGRGTVTRLVPPA
jgi:23S rRNA (adenine2030-N6)-methyltransferase